LSIYLRPDLDNQTHTTNFEICLSSTGVRKTVRLKQTLSYSHLTLALSPKG